MKDHLIRGRKRPTGWPGFLFIAGCVVSGAFLASCQTSPAVSYVPPKPAEIAPPERASAATLDDLVQKLDSAVLGVLGASPSADGLLKVAVIRFTDIGGESHALGRYLALKMGTDIGKVGTYIVIDPGQIHQLLRREAIEQGIVDTRSLLEIGRKVGADRLVVGNYTDLGSQLDVTVRVLTVPEGHNLGQASETVDRDAALMNLIHVGP